MSGSMTDKLKRRKLDALKRGVHRVPGGEVIAVSSHMVGIGKAGAAVIAEILRGLDPDGPKFFALAIDIGDQDLAELRALSATISSERADVTIVALDAPERDVLLNTLQQYPNFLALEYPNYVWGGGYEPWLTPGADMPQPGGHVRRAVAKAIYGAVYYAAPRSVYQALRTFAKTVETARTQAVVSIVFGLGGGTGSGIAVDLARHLSSRMLGRAALVAGIGIAPCDGDARVHLGGQLFAALNELDCLNDDAKNGGVVASCGDLFRNPFTAGFVVVPQQHVWLASHDLTLTHRRADQEVATLLTGRGGTNLWETLRLLNWVAAPSTQHSAARTPWGAKWIHMLGYADSAGAGIAVGPALPEQLGVRPAYRPEFIEMRVAGTDTEGCAVRLEAAFSPDVPPAVVDGGREGAVQFILPSISKADLHVFHEAREAYDSETPGQRLLDHALLLDQGVVLSEKSTTLQGMAGASVGAGAAWIAVSFADLRGEDVMPPASPLFFRPRGLSNAA